MTKTIYVVEWRDRTITASSTLICSAFASFIEFDQFWQGLLDNEDVTIAWAYVTTIDFSKGRVFAIK